MQNPFVVRQIPIAGLAFHIQLAVQMVETDLEKTLALKLEECYDTNPVAEDRKNEKKASL